MFKAIAAAQAGADLMLVHPTNLAEAEAAGTGVEVVAVTSFADAIAYLRRSSLTGPK
jgi:predicted S18 family serine protease